MPDRPWSREMLMDTERARDEKRGGEQSSSKLLVTVVVVMLMGLIFGIVLLTFHPARRSNDEIRREVLELTPLGCNAADVERFARERLGRVTVVYYADAGCPRHMAASYGHYFDMHSLPWSTTVRVMWFFNKEGRLDDIQISRFNDGS